MGWKISSHFYPHIYLKRINKGNILLTHKFKNKLIFALVNLGLNHWVLLVINPGAEMIYYMDSLPEGHPNIDVVRKKFMNAMCICRSLNPKLKSKSSIIPWKEIKR